MPPIKKPRAIDNVARRIIREGLVERGITQQELADYLGVGQGPVSRRLRDGAFYAWSLGELVDISDFLNLDLLKRVADEHNKGKVD